MNRENDSKDVKSHPLTVSVSVGRNATPPPPISNLASETAEVAEDDHVTTEDSGPLPKTSPSATHRSRFYFESDTLALKNNPE